MPLCPSTRSQDVDDDEGGTDLTSIEGVILPQDTLCVDAAALATCYRPRTTKALRNMMARRTEVMLRRNGIQLGPRDPQDNANCGFWSTMSDIDKEMIHATRKSKLYLDVTDVAPNLKTILIDFIDTSIRISLNARPFPGCGCHGLAQSPKKSIPQGFVHPDDTKVVIDLYDYARIDSLCSLGVVKPIFELETAFSYIEWMRYRWKTTFQARVTSQWVAMMALREGKSLKGIVQRKLDSPDSIGPWVQDTLEAMPKLKPVVTFDLTATHFAGN